MALTQFAQVSDLVARWRPLTSEESARADILLQDASQLILDEDRRGLYADLEEGDTPPATLTRIVCAVVKRSMSAGGDSVSSQQQTAGPFGLSTTYANPTGDLYLTAAERRALGFTRQRAGGVDMFEA